jgi:hypothetical protein
LNVFATLLEMLILVEVGLTFVGETLLFYFCI